LCELLARQGKRKEIGSWLSAWRPENSPIEVRDPSWSKLVQTGSEFTGILAHSDTVTGIAISPDMNRIAATNSVGRVKVWDADNGKELLDFHAQV